MRSYGKIHNENHYDISLFSGPVVCQEKVDGSQFAFMVDNDGVLHFRNKRRRLNLEKPPKMFAAAMQHIESIKDNLHPEWTYYGECLSKPCHHVLKYSRIPVGGVILFDIMVGHSHFLKPQELQEEATRLSLDCVPVLYEGLLYDPTALDKYLKTQSVLGGTEIEGMVIKNYTKYYDGKPLMGKYVSPEYREISGGSLKQRTKTTDPILEDLVLRYGTYQRFSKTVIHLMEDNQLELTNEDIPLLLKELGQDIMTECSEEIKEYLFRYFWKYLIKNIYRKFVSWYKAELQMYHDNGSTTNV